MKRIAPWIAVPLLIGCTLRAADRPVITDPVDGQRIGGKKDSACRSAEQPCFRIEAEGRVPEGTYPAFVVEPMSASPRMWVQPRIHSVAADGSVLGTIYLGEEDNGARELYKIYLLACSSEKALGARKTILRVPKGCAVSHAVKVYRAR
jgi:hypothetical protein